MSAGETLLEAICREPGDALAWLALADWLEEEGQPDRAELSRLTHRLRSLGCNAPARKPVQARAQELLLAGVDPCMPEVVNSIGMRLTLIPAGTFWMGAPRGEAGRVDGEGPRHPVAITRTYFLGTFSVMQGEYASVMGENPSHFRTGGPGRKLVKGLDTSRFPVETVTWHDAEAFCLKLTGLPDEKQAGRTYRLPTEAEWEHACRAGTTTVFHCGTSFTSRLANFDGNYPTSDAAEGPFLRRTCESGSYRPNLWGLYDMTGNVWDWCSDWHDATYYTRKRMTDPRGPEEGDRRCRRGGSWYMNATQCRSAYRSSNAPDSAVEYCGFRVVMVQSASG